MVNAWYKICYAGFLHLETITFIPDLSWAACNFEIIVVLNRLCLWWVLKSYWCFATCRSHYPNWGLKCELSSREKRTLKKKKVSLSFFYLPFPPKWKKKKSISNRCFLKSNYITDCEFNFKPVVYLLFQFGYIYFK